LIIYIFTRKQINLLYGSAKKKQSKHKNDLIVTKTANQQNENSSRHDHEVKGEDDSYEKRKRKSGRKFKESANLYDRLEELKSNKVPRVSSSRSSREKLIKYSAPIRVENKYINLNDYSKGSESKHPIDRNDLSKLDNLKSKIKDLENKINEINNGI